MPYSNPDAQREFQRRWCATRRQQALTAFGSRCSECESSDRLEFHHGDRSVKLSRRIRSWKWERILAELSKCVLLCKHCHAELTSPILVAKALAQPRNGAEDFVSASTVAACPIPRIPPGSAQPHTGAVEEVSNPA
jgi:hypothetical protein